VFLCEHRSYGSLPMRGLNSAAHSTHLFAKRPHPGSLRDHHILARIHPQSDEPCGSRGLVLELEPVVWCFRDLLARRLPGSEVPGKVGRQQIQETSVAGRAYQRTF